MFEQTIQQYQTIIAKCKDIFEKKNKDYGLSWQVMRTSSLTDQILIKAKRIRNLQENEIQKIQEDQGPEFIGIVNYAIIALIQLDEKYEAKNIKTSLQVMDFYQKITNDAYELMLKKNHDYGEIWRSMRISSMTDFMLMKLMRIRQIEDNGVQFSEGLSANFQDILNYAVFCLILFEE